MAKLEESFFYYNSYFLQSVDCNKLLLESNSYLWLFSYLEKHDHWIDTIQLSDIIPS